jgi:hypothetical protein
MKIFIYTYIYSMVLCVMSGHLCRNQVRGYLKRSKMKTGMTLRGMTGMISRKPSIWVTGGRSKSKYGSVHQSK